MSNDPNSAPTRRSVLKASSGAAALTAGLSSSAAAAPAQSAGVNKNSAPSDLKITDMRAVTIAANYDYPIIRIDTNQGVYGYGEVRDAGVKGIALILKAHLVGQNPLDISRNLIARVYKDMPREERKQVVRLLTRINDNW